MSQLRLNAQLFVCHTLSRGPRDGKMRALEFLVRLASNVLGICSCVNRVTFI